MSKSPKIDTAKLHLEERIHSLENELQCSNCECEKLQTRLAEKHHELDDTQRQKQREGRDAADREQELLDKIRLIQNDNEAIKGQLSDTRKLQRDLQATMEEKAFLQSRHHALTVESQSTQRDLIECRRELAQLRQELARARRSNEDIELDKKTGANEKVAQLSQDIRTLHKQLDQERQESKAMTEDLRQHLQDVSSQRDKAEQKTVTLQRTIGQLEQGEKRYSDRQLEIQEAAASERRRSAGEEARQASRIKEIEASYDEARTLLEQARSEAKQAQEELDSHLRNQSTLDGRVQALEDEIDVLQGALEDDACIARTEIARTGREARDLKQQLRSEQREKTELKAAQNAAMERISQLQSEQEQSQRTRRAQLDAQAQIDSFHSEQQKIVRLQIAHADALKQVEELQASQQDSPRVRSALTSAEAQLASLSQENESLHRQLDDMEAELHSLRHLRISDLAKEGQTCHHDLPLSRDKEAEYTKRDFSHREEVRSLRRERAELERSLHETRMEILAMQNRELPATDSGNVDIPSLRRQLSDSQIQLKLFIADSRESDQNALRRIADMQKLSQQQYKSLETQRAELEKQLEDLRLERIAGDSKVNSIAMPITCLHGDAKGLETDLRSTRATKSADRATTVERKELHKLLKSAKLNAEDLQLQLKESNTQLGAALAREHDMRSQLQKVRSDYRLKQKQVSALSKELDGLQRRFEGKIEEMAAKQNEFDDECRKLHSKARKSDAAANTEAAKKVELEVSLMEARHAAELRELSKKIQRLRTRCKREEGLREGLAFGKRYLQLQIEMYQSW